MRRREVIAGLGGAAAWPLVARGQQSTVPVVGYLNGFSPNDVLFQNVVSYFRQGLAETGYVEGQNVAIEYRWAEEHNDRLPALVADLIRRRVAVIVVANTTAAALAAKAATETIPIVFNMGTDPVAIGLVASLRHPGGNLTGTSILTTAIMAKRLELLHELVPAATRIALLSNPTNPLVVETETSEAKSAAHALGLQLLVLSASNESEIEAAFETLAQQKAEGLLVSADVFFLARRDQVVALAAHHAVPAIYAYSDLTLAGGLMSYATSRFDAAHLLGVYTGRILKGEKPADLPVQQSTRIEMVLNLKTAKALGLTIPETLLATADEVIQ
jgi:putative tryptophan/tyrosine transport system substrate-binding protein